MTRGLALVWLALFACGRNSSTAAPPPKKDAGAPRDVAAEIEIEGRLLGKADLADFAWRKRPGQPAFRNARKAEGKEDWETTAKLCREALAADPTHLEASWLLAVALAKTGKLDEVLAPLHDAVAGDFGKWGQPSLDQPALQAFLATPTGEAWRTRIDDYRTQIAAALARSIVVVDRGDLVAFDPEQKRWHRLTRTLGAVQAGLAAPGGRQIAYVTRDRKKKTQPRQIGIGVVDLTRARTLKAVATGAGEKDKVLVAYSTTKQPGFWIGIGPVWRQIDDDAHFHALPAKTPRPNGPWLEVMPKAVVRMHRLPVASVSADWDDQSLASAIRIGTSNRVVSARTGLVDGNSAVWSPDRARLAFVAIDDHCTPGAEAAAAYVVDAATGNVQELERAANGIALDWFGDRKLAIAGDHGVHVVDLGGGEALAFDGETSLVVPKRKPRCVPEPVEPVEPVDDPNEPLDPDEPEGAVEPNDAGL